MATVVRVVSLAMQAQQARQGLVVQLVTAAQPVQRARPASQVQSDPEEMPVM